MGTTIQPEIFENFKGVTISSGANAPPWLPPEMRGFSLDQPFNLEISRAERRVFRSKKSIGTASQWAESDRVITTGPMAGHTIDFSITPYIPDLLDAIDDPCVKEASLCFAAQCAKSTLLDTFIGNRAVNDPGPALIIYPDKETAEENCRDRIKAMIDQTPSLRKLKTGYAADEKGIKIKLLTMSIHMGWSGSITSLGNKTIRYLIKDEKDKHKELPSKNEASSSDSADQRTRAYPYNKKIINASTPTVESGPIWQDITDRANVLFRFKAKCPDCGHLQQMVFGDADMAGGIKWPKDTSDPKVVMDEFLAWYQCENCPSQWDDLKRDVAMQLGGWFAPDGRSLKAYMTAYRPSHIAAHVPAWFSHFVSLSECAAKFLEGVKNRIKRRNFQNNYAAEPSFDNQQERKEDVIMALADDRPEGLVPGGGVVACLVAGVDTHPGRLNYQIQAIGYGIDPETWVVRYGTLTGQEALRKVLWEREYRDVDGNVYPVRFTLQDAMGHNTDEVYEFCRQHRGLILPAKGHQKKAVAVSYGNLDIFPGSKKPIPGGLQLVNIDTNYFKDKLSNMLDVSPTDPGAYHLHSDVDLDYAKQMTTEFINEKQIWDCPEHGQNHYWDCANLCLVAAHIMDVKHWPTPEQVATASQTQTNKPAGNVSRSSFMSK